jgi:hypothetical protein
MPVIPNKWVKKDKTKKTPETIPTRESSSPFITKNNMTKTLRGVRK